MGHKRFWIAGLALVLVLALLPAGAQATPPIGGDTISFGAGNDVGASADDVYSVAVGDLDGDGDLDVVTGSASDEDYEVIAWQNNGTPFSGTWTQHDVGATEAVQSVALGDLDGDGDLDVVSGDSTGVISVWQNDGTPFNGTWTSNQVGDNAWEARIALGDLDNDGDLDIVSGTSTVEDFEIAVWQNDGAPFSGAWAHNDVGVSTATVYSVALGDLDDDGDLDVVSAGDSGEDYEIIAWRNDGTPFSGLWAQNDVGASAARVWSLAVGDLDNDGDLDIVSGGSWEEDREVIAWQNDGTPFSGLWVQNDVGATSVEVFSVVVGDLDGDGDLDVVSGNDASAGTEVSGWQNDGTPFSGLWTESEVGHSDSNVLSVALGDLDGDGDLDVVTGSDSREDYEVIACPNTLVHRNMPFDPAGNGVGASTGNVLSVALGDLDDDGDLDAVSGSNTDEDYEVIAWRNGGAPFSGPWMQNDVGASTGHVRSVALGDLDGDGDLDVVTGSTSGEDFEVIAWRNDGTPFSGTWTPNDVGASTAHVRSVALGDLDDDGDLDVVSGGDSGENYEVIAWQNDGTPFSGLWTPNDVGASAGNVNSVALGDLDDDGDLDIATGSASGEDFEVIAWRNDGTPFSGLWTPNDVGAGTDHVNSVALGDLDGDGDLDIVSGSGLGEDYEVIAWHNDGTPFSGLWTPNDVGASTGFVTSVALGDLDEDGDLDVASGSSSSEDYEVITWRNDGTPFSGLWTQSDAGATDTLQSVALGDLDGDGDLDIVSGSNTGADYEVIAWRNVGGSAAEDSTETAPAGMEDSQTDDLLRVVATHNGISGDNDLELAQVFLLFEETGGDPLTSTEANNLIENLYVYYSTNGTWELADTVVATISSLSLSSGVQTIQFTDGDGNVQIPALTSKTYFVVAEMTANASAQTPDTFRITFDADANSLVEDWVEDSSVSIEDSGPVTAEVITSASPLTTTVNSTNDVDDGVCNVAHCSLREAINAANSNSGTDTIAFNITSGCGAGGVCTIQPTSALPALTDNGTAIDGYTQPGAAPATGATPAVLKIEIDGTNAGAAGGLHLASSNNSISGLVINRFSQSGVFISGGSATGNTVSGNYIGTDANGTAGLGNSYSGVAIRGAAQNNTIGGDTAGERNAISGNGEAGVWIYDNGTLNNTVSGNYIGTDANGTAVLSNTGDGVAIGGGAQSNAVGPDNVIAHNGEDGIEVYESNTTGNTITHNSIFSNTMGINLVSSANGRIAAPVIVTTTLGSVHVVGSACPGCTVEVFENGDTDGEGETYVGSSTATGSGAFTVTASYLSKPYLTATATGVVSGTSEFSAVFTATVTGPAPVYLPLVLRSF